MNFAKTIIISILLSTSLYSNNKISGLTPLELSRVGITAWQFDLVEENRYKASLFYTDGKKINHITSTHLHKSGLKIAIRKVSQNKFSVTIIADRWSTDHEFEIDRGNSLKTYRDLKPLNGEFTLMEFSDESNKPIKLKLKLTQQL